MSGAYEVVKRKRGGYFTVCSDYAADAVWVSGCGAEQSGGGPRMAEDNLRRAVVSCYALEGRYPPDVKYLQEQYGLQLNEEKYIVHYEVFAENIMPDITVLER